VWEPWFFVPDGRCNCISQPFKLEPKEPAPQGDGPSCLLASITLAPAFSQHLHKHDLKYLPRQ